MVDFNGVFAFEGLFRTKNVFSLCAINAQKFNITFICSISLCLEIPQFHSQFHVWTLRHRGRERKGERGKGGLVYLIRRHLRPRLTKHGRGLPSFRHIAYTILLISSTSQIITILLFWISNSRIFTFGYRFASSFSIFALRPISTFSENRFKRLTLSLSLATPTDLPI